MKRLKDTPIIIALMMLTMLLPGGDYNSPGVQKIGLRILQVHRCGFQTMCCDTISKCYQCVG